MRPLPLSLPLLALALTPAAAAAARGPYVTIRLSSPGTAAEVPLAVPIVRSGDVVLFHAAVRLRSDEPRPILTLQFTGPEGFRAYTALTASPTRAGLFYADAVMTGSGDTSADAYEGGRTWRRLAGAGGDGVSSVSAQAVAVPVAQAAKRPLGRRRSGSRVVSLPAGAQGHPAWHCRSDGPRRVAGRAIFGTAIAPEPTAGPMLAGFGGRAVARFAQDAFCGTVTAGLRRFADALAAPVAGTG